MRSIQMDERFNSTRLHFLKFVYLLMLVLSFYLLYISRQDEVYTVWGAVPAEFPIVFFAATVLLVWILFSSDKTSSKLMLTIVHSILSLSFYAIVFPFGRTGVPQMVLGETRLVFDSITPFGLPAWPTQPAANIFVQTYRWARVYNLETLLTVVSARMFGVDVLWSNLVIVPFLWAIFMPVVAHSIAKDLYMEDRIPVLASVIVLVFPTLIFYGSFSSRNSLGFIFFFASLFFCVKYTSTDRQKWAALSLFMSLASFLSHFLTGIVSFSLFSMAVALRLYRRTKQESATEAKVNLLLSFFICMCFLPLALILHGFVYHLTTSFSLGTLSNYTITEAIAVAVFGEYAFFDTPRAMVFGLGPLLGLIGTVYYLRRSTESGKTSHESAEFLLGALLLVWFDYRIIKLLMINVPFEVERLLAFGDLILVPIVALLLGSLAVSLVARMQNVRTKNRFSIPMSAKSLTIYAIISLLIAGWISVSTYYAYPTYGVLQTTYYEVEAVKYIERTSNGTYIVVGDPWIIFAGEMFVGIHNPRAFYFFYQDPYGTALYTRMKNNPSNDTLLEALKYNNATVAYFVVEQPRLGDREFNRVISQAQQNGVAVYESFASGKLCIFYYKK